MKTIPMIVLLSSIPLVAHAMAMPKYDVDKFCHQLAKGADGSMMVRNACIDLEQESYNKLKKMWKNIPEKTQKYCDTIARGLGSSYQGFEECRKMEMEQEKKTFKP